MTNIVRIAILTGKIRPYICTNTHSSVLSNSIGSSKAFRVYCVKALNIGTDQARFYISIRRSGQDNYFTKRMFIDPKESVVIINKYEYIFLEEGDEIYASNDIGDPIHLTITYEEVTPVN